MTDHIKGILTILHIFAAIAFCFFVASASRYLYANSQKLSAEAAITFLQQKELFERIARTQKLEAEELNRKTAETKAALAAEEEKNKLAEIIQKLEVGRRICIGAHEETWWFVCLQANEKGEKSISGPCEKNVYVCDDWAVRKGLEVGKEKTWTPP